MLGSIKVFVYLAILGYIAMHYIAKPIVTKYTSEDLFRKLRNLWFVMILSLVWLR